MGEAWDSQKQQRFVESGLKDPVTQEYKLVADMGGIGKVSEMKLGALGFTYAYQLIGHYMVSSLDDEAINHWLEHEVGVNSANVRNTIIGTMRKWCEAHL